MSVEEIVLAVVRAATIEAHAAGRLPLPHERAKARMAYEVGGEWVLPEHMSARQALETYDDGRLLVEDFARLRWPARHAVLASVRLGVRGAQRARYVGAT